MTSESAIKLIKAYTVQKQWSNIIKLCTQHLNQYPQRIELYPFLAKAYVNQDRIPEAIATYQKALNTPLNQAEVHAELGLLYSKQQQLVKAAWHYQQALMIDPEWAELQYNLAIILYQLGDWKKALAAFQEALRIKPDYAAVYFNLGVLYDSKGEFKTASDYYQKAIDTQPRYLKAYSNLGSTLAKQQKYATAIKVLKQGLEIDPTWSTLHNNLGQIYFLNRQLDRAFNSFEMAICLEPNMSLAYSNLSKLWQQKGNFDRVIENLQKLIELEPNNVAAFGHLATILLHQGKSAAAIKYLRQAIAIEPRFVTSYCAINQAADSSDLLSQAKRACAKFLTALQTTASDAEAIESLWQTYSRWGDFLLKQGKVEQAEAYYRQGLEVNPQEISLYLNLGNTLAQQKKWQSAVDTYQMGLRLQPQHQLIARQLQVAIQNQQNSSDSPSKLTLPPAEPDFALLPQAMYRYTRDWVRDCQLKDYSYTEVCWEGTTPTATTPKQTAVKIKPYQPYSQKTKGKNSCNRDLTKLVEYFQPVSLGHEAYQCSFNHTVEITASFPFVVIIPQGKAWNIPQQNDEIDNFDQVKTLRRQHQLTCDRSLAITTPDHCLLEDLSSQDLRFFPPYSELEKTFPIFNGFKQLPQATNLKGKVALLSGLASNSYYHWLFDILPRLELIRLSDVEFKSIDWFVFNELEKPFQRESLGYLDIPLTKVVKSNQHSLIEAEELIVPSSAGYLNWIPFGTIKFLRQTFLPKIANLKVQQLPRIYLSRKGLNGRYLANESAITKFLARFDFQTVYPQEMSLVEQAALFANAQVIVSSHSSELSNLVFCAPKTIVVELFSPHHLRTNYWALSQQLELKHYYCVGENFDCLPLQNIMYPNSLNEDTLINLNSLELVFQAARVSD